MCAFLKPVCENRSNKSDFVILPNSLSQISTDPKQNGNLELEFNNQQNLWKMNIVALF